MTSFAKELCDFWYSCEASVNDCEAALILVVVKRTPFFCVVSSMKALLLRRHEES